MHENEPVIQHVHIPPSEEAWPGRLRRGEHVFCYVWLGCTACPDVLLLCPSYRLCWLVCWRLVSLWHASASSFVMHQKAGRCLRAVILNLKFRCTAVVCVHICLLVSVLCVAAAHIANCVLQIAAHHFHMHDVLQGSLTMCSERSTAVSVMHLYLFITP